MQDAAILRTGATEPKTERVDAAIRRGLMFLAERQMLQGEFLTYLGTGEDLEGWAVPDAVTFTTALVGTVLLPWRDDPVVSPMLEKAAAFLKYQIISSGTWNYYAKWSKYFRMVPCDSDDTACISFFLREMGVPFPGNREMLLSNRNPEGLFYTWFVFRFSRSKNINYWKTVLREWKRPLQTLYFWKRMAAGRNTVHPIVNANVLFYLGRDWCTRPVIGWLLKIVAENREATCDPWYHNPFFVWYMITRNYARGIRELRPAGPLIRERILATAEANGCIGGRPLNTALALTTLLWFRCTDPEIHAAARYLLDCQFRRGSWARQMVIRGGASARVGWGSEELSTALCLEALRLYRQMKTAETRKTL